MVPNVSIIFSSALSTTTAPLKGKKCGLRKSSRDASRGTGAKWPRRSPVHGGVQEGPPDGRVGRAFRSGSRLRNGAFRSSEIGDGDSRESLECDRERDARRALPDDSSHPGTNRGSRKRLRGRFERKSRLCGTESREPFSHCNAASSRRVVGRSRNAWRTTQEKV